jgi:uncharacterized protein (DUF952 family)
MRIFHIATVADWEAARRVGSYTTSTYGVTLAEEGFIHASRSDQWQGVRERFYGAVTEPLVLLEIDTDKLTAPVVDETPPGADETFPHIYGTLNPDAVVRVSSLGGESFSRLFFEEMFRNLLLASLVLACVAVAAGVGNAVDDEWGALVGTLVGLLVGVAGAVAISRRRRR